MLVPAGTSFGSLPIVTNAPHAPTVPHVGFVPVLGASTQVVGSGLPSAAASTTTAASVGTAPSGLVEASTLVAPSAPASTSGTPAVVPEHPAATATAHPKSTHARTIVMTPPPDSKLEPSSVRAARAHATWQPERSAKARRGAVSPLFLLARFGHTLPGELR